ncbi:Uncharacterised protein [Pseudomonas putida]|jgi:hypothetical protein|uniref:Uncharacterized protein n=1 Tax=Pseudomonas putida TaxID=303 RepID=A0A379KSU6_PSEPU|nr:hypothetical protein [Pseudomonas sp. M2]SUD70640.1 Uncharacterised protein [Pseudomonas putida]
MSVLIPCMIDTSEYLGEDDSVGFTQMYGRVPVVAIG